MKAVETGEFKRTTAKAFARALGQGFGVPGTSSIVRFFDTADKIAKGEMKHPPADSFEAAKDLFITGDR